MQIPARLLKVSPSWRGIKSEEGWLEIEISKVDTEGASKIYINLDDVARLKAKRDQAADLLGRWDAVFGKKDEACESE
ncbi:MAG: hypothetical protein ACUVX8_06380 [Candidatus Zipacnadales bacterium]